MQSYQIQVKASKENITRTKIIYKILKRHGLNILECKIKNRNGKGFNEKTKPDGTDGHIGTILS